jgi:hypothetical protein
MSLVTIPTAQAALPRRRNRLIAVALTVVLAAGAGAALDASGLEHPGAPANPEAWPAGPIGFDDPAVVKGARGGNKNTVRLPFFGDPTVRKGAGGQR